MKGAVKRRFSAQEMKELGLDDPWEGEAIVETIDGVGSHGTQMRIIFTADNTFWAIDVDYHHEDWEGTSDVCEAIRYGSSMEAVEVYPKEVVTTRWIPVGEMDVDEDDEEE